MRKRLGWRTGGRCFSELRRINARVARRGEGINCPFPGERTAGLSPISLTFLSWADDVLCYMFWFRAEEGTEGGR